MRQGHTLPEIAVALTIAGIVTSVTLPRIAGLLDRVAVEQAASTLTTALAVTRNRAVLRATRERLSITADSLGLEEWQGGAWTRVRRWPGPGDQGVAVSTSSPLVTFDAVGLAWGLSNTTIQLSRRSHTATVTTSRLGRIKRW